MRYLKRYKSFNEDTDFDPKVTDAPDIKMPKEELSSIMNQIKDFKQKKVQIDQIYLKATDDKQLADKIKILLGPQTSSKEDRNPFLVEYLNVSDLKRRLDKSKKDAVDDKLKLDDFNQDIKSATDQVQKASIQQKISDINKRIGLSNTTISKISSDITNADKSLSGKMDKIEKDMKDYIKKLSLPKV